MTYKSANEKAVFLNPRRYTADNPEMKIVLSIIAQHLETNPTRWTKIVEACVGVSEAGRRGLCVLLTHLLLV